MAIICHNSRGAVIDHLQSINNIYGQSADGNNGSQYRFKSDVFGIQSPFTMDSQFAKLQAESDLKNTEQNHYLSAPNSRVKRKRNKKRKFSEMSKGEQEALKCHEQIHRTLETALHQLVDLARQHEYLCASTQPVYDNNVGARRAAQLPGPGHDLVRRCEEIVLDVHTGAGAVDLHHTQGEDELFGRLVQHNGECVHLMDVLGGRYIIPPHCSFIMSDIQHHTPLINSDCCFDLIVADPPWYNKSVKRKHKYRMMYDEELLHIPVHSIAKHGCLVVVWATNNQQQQRFIRQQLLPAWGATYLTQWFWIKVTQNGEPVLALDNRHKKPYETLILGYVTQKQVPPLTTEASHVPEANSHVSKCVDHVTGTSDHVTQGTSGHVTQGTSGHVTQGTSGHVTQGSSGHVTQGTSGHVTQGTSGHVTQGTSGHVTQGTSGHVTQGTSGHVTQGTSGHVTQGTSGHVTQGTSGHVTQGTSGHVTDDTGHVTAYSHVIPDRLHGVEDNYVVVSVPSSLHSHKPPLTELLRRFLPPEPQCLEMFARCLQPGWVSWGNEVLRLQHTDFYQPSVKS